MTDNKKIIGILGGISSGKSTVADQLAKLGCAIIDADHIAHELLDDENIRQRLRKVFPETIFDPDGRVNRDRLAQIVFDDPHKMTELNDIIHPPVLSKCRDLISQYRASPEVPAIVLDIPLLLEVGWEKTCDKIIFVDCKEQIRAQRAQKKAFLSKNQIKKRENLQISLDNKAKNAHYIVDNNSDLSALAEQVELIFTTIIE